MGVDFFGKEIFVWGITERRRLLGEFRSKLKNNLKKRRICFLIVITRKLYKEKNKK